MPSNRSGKPPTSGAPPTRRRPRLATEGGIRVNAGSDDRADRSSAAVDVVDGGDLVILKPDSDGQLGAVQADGVTCTPGAAVLVLILGTPTVVSDDAAFRLGQGLALASHISVWGPVDGRFRADVARGVRAARTAREQQAQDRLRAERMAALGYTDQLNAAAERVLRHFAQAREGAA